MIQRIQTIFLFLAAAAALALYALPLATTDEAQPTSAIFADADFDVQDAPVMMITFGLTALMMLVAIFLYNNRILQRNITKIAVLVAIIGVGVAVYHLYVDHAAKLAEPALGAPLPILVLLLGALASRYINKDEKLVKSVDRLR